MFVDYKKNSRIYTRHEHKLFVLIPVQLLLIPVSMFYKRKLAWAIRHKLDQGTGTGRCPGISLMQLN